MYSLLKRLCEPTKKRKKPSSVGKHVVPAFLYGIILFNRNKHMSALATRNRLFFKHSGTSAAVSISSLNHSGYICESSSSLLSGENSEILYYKIQTVCVIVCLCGIGSKTMRTTVMKLLQVTQ